MTSENEIITLNGKYEVHPDVSDTCWHVVNGETGTVRCSFSSREDAIASAEDLNAEEGLKLMLATEAVQKLTDAAEALGATANDEDGKVRALVLAHGLGFNAWFCVCCELADRKARSKGYRNEVDRAYSLATANR